MATILSITAVALAAAQSGTAEMGKEGRIERAEAFAKTLVWTGQDSLRLDFGGAIVVVDPLAVPSGADKADFILLTHPHQDHFAPASVKAWATDTTTLLCPVSMENEVRSIHRGPVKALSPGDAFPIGSANARAVPAYNLKKTRFHPKENGWLGYVLSGEGLTVYITGDSERIPEMATIKADVILLPLGQVYTMNSVEEAAGCVTDTGAIFAIPIHWGQYEGSTTDVRRFRELLESKAEVFVPPRQPSF